jgi:hypothetical protein
VWEGAVETLLVGLITVQHLRWIFMSGDYFLSRFLRVVQREATKVEKKLAESGRSQTHSVPGTAK